ncbi:MAG TPA: amino acid transporter, partial [Vicinamibacteria bacterium]|nr:amino acid transporter [Vicinamibacteria bacterium]
QYRQILDYMIAVDFLFFALTGACLFVFRRRDPAPPREGFTVPGHPLTTGLFVLGCAAFVVNLVIGRPKETLLGFGILALGIPAFFAWRLARR